MNKKDWIVVHELLNAYIQRDLARLEEAIQYQQDHNWENETLVTQKLDDAIGSIILHSGMESNKEKENILLKLHDYINEFKAGDRTFDVSLNDKQRADYIHLAQKLRTNGWNYGVGYDTSWDAFASKVTKLIGES